MEKWNTRLILKTKQEVMQSQPIQTRIQGDSLLPLFFCIALIPLTNELNRADCGYQVHGTERKISHLLYSIQFNSIQFISLSIDPFTRQLSHGCGSSQNTK